MDDLIGQLRRDVEKRLKELEPLIEEKDRLEAILVALSEQVDGRPRASRKPSATSSPKAPAPANRASYAGGKSRASRGANREAILTLVGERPGISASEVADITQITKATVHTTISQLKRKGILEAHGDRGVRLAQSTDTAPSPPALAPASEAPPTIAEDEPPAYAESGSQDADHTATDGAPTVAQPA